MSVAQYTTPTFTLTFTEDNLDLTQAENVYVTFKCRNNLLTKTGEDLTVGEKTIAVQLTQEETGRFCMGEHIKIQANWTTASGDRAASNVVLYDISEQLLQKVVE